MVDGSALTFEVFGLLKQVLTMVDRETGSVWTHLDGNAIQGPMSGARMAMIPAPQMTWGEWRTLNPDTSVLSPDTPFADRYRPVRIGRLGGTEQLFGDDRLPPNTLVVGVEVGGQFRAYPVEELRRVGGLVNDTLSGQPILVLFDPGSEMGLAFSRLVDGQTLHFYDTSEEGLELRDGETDSEWDLLGQGGSGPLAESALEFVPSFISEWYGWSAYHPETTLFEAEG